MRSRCPITITCQDIRQAMDRSGTRFGKRINADPAIILRDRVIGIDEIKGRACKISSARSTDCSRGSLGLNCCASTLACGIVVGIRIRPIRTKAVKIRSRTVSLMRNLPGTDCAEDLISTAGSTVFAWAGSLSIMVNAS